jgi:rod shape-determining protein MreC
MKITKKTYLALAVLTLVVYYFKQPIQSNFLTFFDSVKNAYFTTTNNIVDFKNRYFNQAKTIKEIKKKNILLQQESYLNNALYLQLEKLQNFNISFNPKLSLVKALSFVNLANSSKVWLSGFDTNDSKQIYGLLYNGFSAGIAQSVNGKLKGFLNNSTKTTYSGYIGENKIVGVIFGDKQEMKIDFIKLWEKPKIGDIVYTSGLDGIFFEGVKVGTVTKIIDHKTYKTAFLKPFANIKIPNYFYLIKETK